MGSLKEIKGRIASVNSTQKITSAMRMVASAKLRRTQILTTNFLRYANALRSITEQLGAITQTVTDAKSVVLIPISSSSGLCGSFNSNIAKTTQTRIKEYEKAGAEVLLMPIGKKIIKEVGKLENQAADTTYGNMNELVERGDVFSAIQSFIANLQKMYADGKIQKAEVIYHHFFSMGKQVIEIKSLPLAPPIVTKNDLEAAEAGNDAEDFITEPDPQTLAEMLHPRMLNSEMYGLLLDALTSEHAARMMAMQTADDNANELLKDLTLQYNKSRQQAITNELIDIMGGKVAQ